MANVIQETQPSKIRRQLQQKPSHESHKEDPDSETPNVSYLSDDVPKRLFFAHPSRESPFPQRSRFLQLARMHVPADNRSEKSVFLRSFSAGGTVCVVLCCRVASVGEASTHEGAFFICYVIPPCFEI